MLLKSLKKYISTFKPGDRLPSEMELSDKFNVSRGTIREVIAHFTMLGILERSARRGTFIKTPTIEEISNSFVFQIQTADFGFEELKEMRMFIELNQAPLLIKLATPISIDRLNTLVNEMEKYSSQPTKANDLDRAFHVALSEICGNRILNIFSQVTSTLFDKKYRKKFLNTRAIKKSINDHRKMIQCIQDQDCDGLKKMITAHIKPL